MPRRSPKRDEVRRGGDNYRRAGTYQTRPMRPVPTVIIEHKGSGWYCVRVDGEVVEDGVRGKDTAQSIKNDFLESYAD